MDASISFLSLYSVVEAALDRHCDICQERFNLKLKKEDLKDKVIVRSVICLENVVEIEDNRIYLIYENMIDIYKHIENFMNFVFSRDCKDKNRSFKIKDTIQ